VVVQGEDGVARKALEQAVGDHALGPAVAASLLGRLEHQVDRAREVARFGQLARRAQQHGGVAVVPAGVHGPRAAAGMGGAAGLQDRQRVHVGAQAHAARAGTGRERANHAVAAHVARDLVAPLGQARGDQLGGGGLLE